MINRDKYQLLTAMLESLPCLKTKMMYNAEINFNQLREFIKLLERSSLIYLNIEEIQNDNGTKGKRNMYYISEKGKEFLRLSKELDDFLLIQEERERERERENENISLFLDSPYVRK